MVVIFVENNNNFLVCLLLSLFSQCGSFIKQTKTVLFNVRLYEILRKNPEKFILRGIPSYCIIMVLHQINIQQ